MTEYTKSDALAGYIMTSDGGLAHVTTFYATLVAGNAFGVGLVREVMPGLSGKPIQLRVIAETICCGALMSPAEARMIGTAIIALADAEEADPTVGVLQ